MPTIRLRETGRVRKEHRDRPQRHAGDAGAERERAEPARLALSREQPLPECCQEGEQEKDACEEDEEADDAVHSVRVVAEVGNDLCVRVFVLRLVEHEQDANERACDGEQACQRCPAIPELFHEFLLLGWRSSRRYAAVASRSSAGWAIFASADRRILVRSEIGRPADDTPLRAV